MSLKSLLCNYAGFNLWANETFADWLKTMPAPLLDKEVPSSYSSLKKTFLHIWDAERFWLSFLQTSVAPKIFTYSFEGSNVAALDGLLSNSKSFSDYVSSLSDTQLLEECILDTPWMKGALPRYEYIQHCFNHSTYHRGQMITISRAVGMTGQPTTDYNYYNMVVGKK